jgi:GAF domain-containing protein
MTMLDDRETDLARENAELRRLLAEALAQQEASAEILGVINSSPGDLQPVFDAILEKALRLCEAAYGHLVTFDGALFHTGSVCGEPTLVEWWRKLGPFQPPEGSVVQRIVKGERLVQIYDASDDEGYRTGGQLLQRLRDIGGMRSLLGIALCKEDVLLGAIIVFRREVRPFTDKQIALLENFAAQAVIAMENARLITETREALEQQTATAEVLGVINSSPGDLTPVFDAMLEKAMGLCEASFGIMFTVDGVSARMVAERHVPEELTSFLRQHPPGIGPDTFFGRAVLGRGVLHTADVRAEAAYRDGQPLALTAVDLAGVRALLMAPLFKDDGVLGVFAIFRQEVRPFTDKQIALLENFAAQAVIAMENARLITETREALEQQTATAEVLQVINASPGDLQPVFDALLDKALDLCGATFGHLLTWDGEYLNRVAARGASPDEALLQRYKPIPGSAGDRLQRGENVISSADLREEGAYRTGSPGAWVLVDRGGARSYVAVALRKDGALLGGIAIYRTEVRPFSDKQIALLQNFAAQAVIAMDNARLINETREALEQQTATAEVLQVINSSPGDLAPVFDAILEKAHTLCGVPSGSMYVRDGEGFRVVAAHGASAFTKTRLEQGFFEPAAGSPLGRILRGEPIIHFADATAEDSYRNDPAYARVIDAGAVRTLLQIPLRKDGEVLGAITAYRREARPFTDKQITLLQNFAAQAVIAMENARLITETREALEQQTATAEVLGVINSSPGDLAPVFDAMVERAARLCEAEEAALRTFDGELLHLAAVHGSDPDVVSQLRQLGPTRTFGLYEPFAHGEPIAHYADVRETEVFREDSVVRARLELRGIRTWLAAALQKDGVLLGVINVHRHAVRPFTDKQIALLKNFAAQAVIAMENARLLTETREALEQQTATAEVLGVINSSPGDIVPVFDAILEKALRLCDSVFGNIRVYDGSLFHHATARGASTQIENFHRGPMASVPGSPLERIIAGETMLHFSDLRESDAYKIGTPGVKTLVEVGGARSWLIVALRKDGVLLGFVSVYRQEVRPFTDKQIALLQNFAAQAVIAMENARLLGELRQRTEEIAAINRDLEERVEAQVGELERVGRLKRFLAPQLAELIVSQGDEGVLESHRREIVVVFCDLRGFTAFTETAEPEEVLDFLREYHGTLGPLVSRFEGTLDQFSGDGIMVFFNDPVPCADPAERAVAMAMAMREAAQRLIAAWRRRGRELGFGAGIAQGYATLGQIGFAERSGYTAIGTVCNVAARLCAEAKDGQILVSQRVAAAVEGGVGVEEVGRLALKGLNQPVLVFNVP